MERSRSFYSGRFAPQWLTFALVPASILAFMLAVAPGAVRAQVLDDTADSSASDTSDKEFNYPAPQSTDPVDLCAYYNRKGVAASRAGFYAQAIDNLQLALDTGQAKVNTLDHWCEFWGLHNELSIAYAGLGDFAQRIRFLQQILPSYESRQDYLRVVSIQSALLESYRTLGFIARMKDSAAALSSAYESLVHKSRAPNSSVMMGSAVYYYAMANYQDYFGNYGEAERARRAALDHITDYVKWARASQISGSRYQNVGERFYVDIVIGLANDLTSEGKLAEAYYYATESVRRLTAISSLQTNSGSLILQMLSDLSLMQGRAAAARRYAGQSVDVLERTEAQKFSPMLAGRRAHLALVLGMQGQWGDALRVFDERDQGLRSRPGARSWDHIDWAMTLLKTGHADRASQMLARMIRVQEQRTAVNPVFVAELHGYLAAALAQGGTWQKAQEEFSLALPVLIEHGRLDARTDSSGYIDKYRTHLILDAYLDHLANLDRGHRALPGMDVAAEAMRIADIARGSSVQGALVGSAARASIADPRLAALAREDQTVGSQKQSLQDVMLRLDSAPAATRLDKVITDMQADIGKLAERQARLRRQMAQDYPDYSQLVDPRPPLPADIQHVLGEDEVCVVLYSNDTQSFVWTITRQRVGFRTVPVNEAQIAQWVAAVRKSVDLSDGTLHPFATEPAWHLYEALLMPDRAQWRGARAMDVIASGALAQLPMGLLLTAPASPSKARPVPYAQMPWLIRDVAIASQPSASSLWALRSLKAAAAPGTQAPFVGFGNPRFNASAGTPADPTRAASVRNLNVSRPQAPDEAGPAAGGGSPEADKPSLAQAFAYLPQLPDTALELQEIAQVLQANPAQDLMLDTHASETEVKTRDLSRYRVIAFATHGLVPGEISGLDQPALALSNPALTGEKTNDGFLTLDEVLALKLNADWVILSACNTASAEGASDEALSGLGRGFFYAGARSLLVSNWSVESASARMLTTGIFEQQQAHPQMTRAEALRQSMLRVMTAQPAYGHPAFWAPFTLAGDGVAP